MKKVLKISVAIFFRKKTQETQLLFVYFKFFSLLMGNIAIKANITRTITKNPPISS